MPEYKERSEPCPHCKSVLDHDIEHCAKVNGIKKWMPNPIDNDDEPMNAAKAINILQRKVSQLESEVAAAKVYKMELMHLIGQILDEAREYPQRLTAFNSPLLGMLMLHYHAHIMAGELDERAMAQFQAVIDAREAP